MRSLIVRHHEEDSAALLGSSLESRGATLSYHRFPDEGPLPPGPDFDAVVILGASWSIYDETSVGSWIGDELRWIRRCDSEGVPVLGICFGAQALATAFGGRVERAPAPEIGWRMIRPASSVQLSPGPWFELHNDRCIVPGVAELLADNDAGAQAFFLGRNLGVQFHPEVDGAELTRWYEAGSREMIEAEGFDPDEILAQTVREERASRRRADEVVDLFFSRATPAERTEPAAIL